MEVPDGCLENEKQKPFKYTTLTSLEFGANQKLDSFLKLPIELNGSLVGVSKTCLSALGVDLNYAKPNKLWVPAN